MTCAGVYVGGNLGDGTWEFAEGPEFQQLPAPAASGISQFFFYQPLQLYALLFSFSNGRFCVYFSTDRSAKFQQLCKAINNEVVLRVGSRYTHCLSAKCGHHSTVAALVVVAYLLTMQGTRSEKHSYNSSTGTMTNSSASISMAVVLGVESPPLGRLRRGDDSNSLVK